MAQIIEYKNVDIYQKEQIVLKDVSLTVQTGQFYYLIGKVGSGKSSLLKTMYAELPVKGDATVLDYYLPKIKNKEIPFLRRKIGIIFQDFQLLTDRSIFDNLQFVLKATGWKNKEEMKNEYDKISYEMDDFDDLSKREVKEMKDMIADNYASIDEKDIGNKMYETTITLEYECDGEDYEEEGEIVAVKINGDWYAVNPYGYFLSIA